MPKILNLTSFWKPTACGQTVLPNGSVLKGQKLVKMPKPKMWHFGWFSNTVRGWKLLKKSHEC